MPAVSTTRLQSLQEKHEQQPPLLPPPSWEWPEFEHPTPVTVAALALIVVLVSILVCILWQLACLHLAHHRRHHHHHRLRRRTYGFVDEQTYADVKHPSLSPPHHHHHKHDYPGRSKRPQRTRRAAALDVQRTPLCSAESERARGSLYDTFQTPSPHAARLVFSRSMMELNGGDPLEGGEGGGGQNKAKTVHWHGVNRLNTAWACMS